MTCVVLVSLRLAHPHPERGYICFILCKILWHELIYTLWAYLYWMNKFIAELVERIYVLNLSALISFLRNKVHKCSSSQIHKYLIISPYIGKSELCKYRICNKLTYDFHKNLFFYHLPASSCQIRFAKLPWYISSLSRTAVTRNSLKKREELGRALTCTKQ